MIKSYTEKTIKDIEKKRELIQAKIDKYKDEAKKCIYNGNLYGMLIYTKTWQDLEQVLEEFNRMIKY